jgi:hypothetical protein
MVMTLKLGLSNVMFLATNVQSFKMSHEGIVQLQVATLALIFKIYLTCDIREYNNKEFLSCSCRFVGIRYTCWHALILG